MIEVIRGLGLGGAETLLYERLKFSIEANIVPAESVKVINTYGQQRHYEGPLRALGVDVRTLKSATVAGAGLELMRTVRRHPNELVVSHSPATTLPLAALSAVDASRRIVDVAHSTKYHRAYMTLGQLMNRFVGGTIAVSQDVQTSPTARGFKNSRVVHAGVDTRRYRRWILSNPGEPARRRELLGFPADATLLCAVGNLNRLKGHRHLLRALTQASLQHAYLVIVGEGPERSALEREACSLGIVNRVRLLGRQANAWQWSAVSDLMCHPSSREGLPVALVEARALNVPILATNVGGVSEVLEGDARSALLPRAEPRSIAAKAACLLRENADASTAYTHRAEAVGYWDIERFARSFSEAAIALGDRSR